MGGGGGRANVLLRLFSFSSLLYNFFLFLKEVREEGAVEDAAKVRVCV